MGKRGPGAGKLRAAAKAYDEAAFVAHPWDKNGMPEAERIIAFLETLPIVSGLKAGETLELIDFQKQFVRGVYADSLFDTTAEMIAKCDVADEVRQVEGWNPRKVKAS